MTSHNRLTGAVPAAMTAPISGVRPAALLGLVLLAATPALAPAQEPAAGAPAKVSVSAQKPWVDSGVDLKAGDALTITSKGQWTNGGPAPSLVTPDGFTGYKQPDSFLNTGHFAGLIGKVGDRLFFVGSAYKGTSPETGRLYLQINDIANSFDDNNGSLDVEIQRPEPPCTASPLDRDRLKDGSDGPLMMKLPACTFLMGSPEGGPGSNQERPVHSVKFAKPFAIGVYEVTFEEYDRFAQATGRERPDDQGTGRGKFPVVNVTWDDARAYAAWLSEQTGARYRLPSEAEWEFAARAGTTTPYWWGTFINREANYNGGGGQWNGKQAAPVGSYEANPFGLYDTAGNVSEWVEDCWHDSYAGAPTDGSAWTAGDTSRRVGRGGSWGNMGSPLRSASRGGFLVFKNFYMGFRLARDL